MNQSCQDLLSDVLFGYQKEVADKWNEVSQAERKYATHRLQSSTDSFVFCTWATMECWKVYNESFHLLTAQNLRITMEIQASSVMCRLGVHNNFTTMGIAVVVADNAGKLMMHIPLSNTKNFIARDMYKSTSVGFDNAILVSDTVRTLYEAWSPALGNVDGSQKIVQVSRIR